MLKTSTVPFLKITDIYWPPLIKSPYRCWQLEQSKNALKMHLKNSRNVICEIEKALLMALLEHCTREKQRLAIRFLHSEDLKSTNFHERTKVQYGN